MRKFFSQFGLVKRIKLFRSAKTGGSKGFAFVEFESSDTASTVAEAMDGYYLLERQIVSHVVPLAKHHEGMFKSSKRVKDDESSDDETDPALPEVTEKSEEKSAARVRKSLRNKQQKLNDLGIDFQ
eukprot:gene35641-43946_t